MVNTTPINEVKTTVGNNTAVTLFPALPSTEVSASVHLYVTNLSETNTGKVTVKLLNSDGATTHIFNNFEFEPKQVEERTCWVLKPGSYITISGDTDHFEVNARGFSKSAA